MKVGLIKHLPKDCNKEEFEKLWNNSSYTLQPYAEFIKEKIRQCDTISEEELKNPNHYGILVHKQTKKQVLLDMLEMLPDTVDKSFSSGYTISQPKEVSCLTKIKMYLNQLRQLLVK